MNCPHCHSTLLWSEDRGAHCDGCDDFDPEADADQLNRDADAQQAEDVDEHQRQRMRDTRPNP